MLNCGFMTSPQLQPLVITNSSIDREQVVREPLALFVITNELGS